ncbi:hypothetical protein [Azohydromonas lata]|uniref:hypothetical protein n=1 Tax=Azohydromonas lata TaxID=45677 RepID=UPI00083795C3|nr:hypothetical protein [Azohydromonas lata]
MPRARITTLSTEGSTRTARLTFSEGCYTVELFLSDAPAQDPGTEHCCTDRAEAVRVAARWVWPVVAQHGIEAALGRFAARHGRGWIEQLQANWLAAHAHGDDGARLQILRNNYGVELLAQAGAAFRP